MLAGLSKHQRAVSHFSLFWISVSFLGQIKASWTIAFWNPGATDTGSILNDDGLTVNEEKLALLKPIMYPGFI